MQASLLQHVIIVLGLKAAVVVILSHYGVDSQQLSCLLEVDCKWALRRLTSQDGRQCLAQLWYLMDGHCSTLVELGILFVLQELLLELHFQVFVLLQVVVQE